MSETDPRSLGCNNPDAGELMPLRLRELGFDPEYLRLSRTGLYSDMHRVCATCRAWQRCTRDLANGDVQTGMRSYCLNAATIDALTVDRLPDETGAEQPAILVTGPNSQK